jgi:hypothetical protein
MRSDDCVQSLRMVYRGSGALIDQQRETARAYINVYVYVCVYVCVHVFMCVYVCVRSDVLLPRVPRLADAPQQALHSTIPIHGAEHLIHGARANEQLHCLS